MRESYSLKLRKRESERLREKERERPCRVTDEQATERHRSVSRVAAFSARKYSEASVIASEPERGPARDSEGVAERERERGGTRRSRRCQ